VVTVGTCVRRERLLTVVVTMDDNVVAQPLYRLGKHVRNSGGSTIFGRLVVDGYARYGIVVLTVSWLLVASG